MGSDSDGEEGDMVTANSDGMTGDVSTAKSINGMSDDDEVFTKSTRKVRISLRIKGSNSRHAFCGTLVRMKIHWGDCLLASSIEKLQQPRRSDGSAQSQARKKSKEDDADEEM